MHAVGYTGGIAICLIAVTLIVSSSNVSVHNPADFDPSSGMKVTVAMDSIRLLEDKPSCNFTIKVFIDGREFDAKFQGGRYLYDIGWEATCDVPDDEENVSIIIQLLDGDNTIYDISGNTYQYAEITYSIKTGQWSGDDSQHDASGYGRLNGCDDGSIYSQEGDCELLFSITQNDEDGDGIPYWIEENVYGTSPFVDDRGNDSDGDGLPIEWEYRWGYDPLTWDDHDHLDPDNDGLTNTEEYMTSQWGSDPFRKDLFIELDQMEGESKDDTFFVSIGTKELLKTVYQRRNIAYHLDDGFMGGGELIPFDKVTMPAELHRIYTAYFLHNDTENWCLGVFHYGVIINKHFMVDGHAFPGNGTVLDFSKPGVNCFQISRKPMMQKAIPKTQEKIDFYYACLIMHETGHTMGLYVGHPPGCDNQFSKYPWQVGSWIFRNYRSVMNYRYTYHILDYSDGSHGERDFDDWGNLDFTFFQAED